MSIHSGSIASTPPPTTASASAFIHERTGTKRTRDEIDGTELDTRPFSIRDPTDPFARPKFFTPVCLLSRAQLPLALLDTAQPGSRLFATHIHSLEASYQHGDDTSVLVAQEGKEKRFYAIERVKLRTYALCKLQDAVRAEGVLKRAKVVLTESDRPPKRQVLETAKDAPWWARAAVDVPHIAEKIANERALPTSTMQRVMNAPAKIGDRSPGPPLEETYATMTSIDTELRAADSAGPPPSPQDVLHDLAKHYMEALYIERTSLAYFTKGPLSRARAAFISQSPDATPADLVDFLRLSIITSAVLDKKYKERLPELVKDMPASVLDSPADVAKRKKNKKKWKARRSKAGFFAEEEDYVKRWWQADGETAATEDVDIVLRQRVSKLRMRETFLQLTLALEALSLESSPGFTMEAEQVASAGPESQAEDSQQVESQIVSDAKPKRPKKKQDLPSLLESLLDKLCIWQSLESLSPAKSRISQDHDNDSNDVLRNFCVEVVVPFFGSRIPQHALLVNKKLGGPAAQSPPKRRSTSIRRPGEPAIRQPPDRKPRQPLARVSTDTLNRSFQRPPILHRSATESDALSHIKRETSETPSLTSVPLSNAFEQAKPQRRSRSHLLEQMSPKPRLIDLSAMSQASEAKLRRKAESDRAIKEAVEGIKKPNRALAVKDVADTTDQSFAKAMAKNTRLQQRGKNAEAERVAKPNSLPTKADKLHKTDVAATPSSYRRRAPGATPYKRAMVYNAGAPPDPTSGPPSSASIVPSSSARLQAPRPTSITEDEPVATFAIPQTGHRARRLGAVNSSAIQETPSRGFAKFMPKSLATQPGTGMLESPVARRTNTVVQATPSKGQPTFAVSAAVAVSAAEGEAGTSLQNDVNVDELEEDDINLDNSVTRRAGNKETSVYTALGWEDDAYEELT